MDWQRIGNEPLNTPILVRIPGYGEDNVVCLVDGFFDDDGNDCCTWVFDDEDKAPPCWTDGACWSTNANGTPSVRPTHWRPYEEGAGK